MKIGSGLRVLSKSEISPDFGSTTRFLRPHRLWSCRDQNLGLSLELSCWLTVSSPHSRPFTLDLGPFLAPNVRKNVRFVLLLDVFVLPGFGLLEVLYMLLADRPEGFSVVPARHTAREPHCCARTFQGTAKNMAHESFYRKTARRTLLHLRHGALHAADMFMPARPICRWGMQIRGNRSRSPPEPSS